RKESTKRHVGNHALGNGCDQPLLEPFLECALVDIGDARPLDRRKAEKTAGCNCFYALACEAETLKRTRLDLAYALINCARAGAVAEQQILCHRVPIDRLVECRQGIERLYLRRECEEVFVLIDVE